MKVCTPPRSTTQGPHLSAHSSWPPESWPSGPPSLLCAPLSIGSGPEPGSQWPPESGLHPFPEHTYSKLTTEFYFIKFHYTALQCLSARPVQYEFYMMLSHCVLLPNSMFKDIMLTE